MPRNDGHTQRPTRAARKRAGRAKEAARNTPTPGRARKADASRHETQGAQ